jgi:hypothetical protein
MRIDPDESDRAMVSARARHAFPRADRTRVIASDHQWERTAPNDGFGGRGEIRADLGNHLEVRRVGSFGSDGVRPDNRIAVGMQALQELRLQYIGARGTCPAPCPVAAGNPDNLDESCRCLPESAGTVHRSFLMTMCRSVIRFQNSTLRSRGSGLNVFKDDYDSVIYV